MSLSRRAKRGIAIFNKIQTSQSRFRYLLSETKRNELANLAKEILHGEPTDANRTTIVGTEPAIPVVGTGRKTVAELAGIAETEHAVPTGEVQPGLYDVHADGPRGTSGPSESAQDNAAAPGPDVPERDERGGH